MLAIVLDTNVLLESPYLARQEWSSLSAHRAEWDLSLVVPDVVRLETINRMRSNTEEERDRFRKAKVAALGVQDAVDSLVQRIGEKILGYEEALDNRFNELGVVIAPVPSVPHLEIARRASLRVAPYKAGDKDGYRDTLIWFTVLDVANQESIDEVWFISNNVRDFGDVSGKHADAAGQITSPLHPDLLRDLEDKGLQGKVKYTRELQALEQHLAAMHGPIPTEEFLQLKDQIDGTALRRLLESELPISISARDAALDPTHTFGMVSKILSNELDWKFSDTSGSGENLWTANYIVDVEAEVVAYSAISPTANYRVRKPLRVSGTATFTRQGVPQKFEVATIEALPDDPDRNIWAILQASGFESPDYISEYVRSIIQPDVSPASDAIEAFLRSQNIHMPADPIQTFLRSQNFHMPTDGLQTFLNSKGLGKDSSEPDPSTQQDEDDGPGGEDSGEESEGPTPN